MSKSYRALLLAGLICLPAFAQTPPPAKTPTLEEVLGASGITLEGYIDASYTHLNRRGVFASTIGGALDPTTPGVPSRVFDFERNSFNLHQVALFVAKQPKEGFGGFVNLTVGKDADVIAPFDTDPQNGTACNVATGQGINPVTGLPESCNKDHFDITQAFVQYAKGPFTIIGGKYVTLAGAEVIKSTANPNFSHSILFGYAIPFSHTGARATFAPSDTLSLMLGVNNGWDDVKDTNTGKTGELGVSWAPTKTFAFGAQGYSGKERVGGLVGTGTEGTRNLVDLVGTFNATDKLSLVLNYDHATQKNVTSLITGAPIKARWNGWAGYVNYQFSDQWRLSLRGEHFKDKDGYRTGVIQKWREATLTLAYLPTKSFEVRAEVRGDRSNVPSFVDTNGLTASKNQSSFGLEALYKF